MENYQKRPKTKRSRFESDNDEPSTLQKHVEGKTPVTTEGVAAEQAKGTHSNNNSSNNTKSRADASSTTHRHGVMHISAHGKIRTYVSRGLEVLLENDPPAATSTSQDPSNNTTSTAPPTASKETEKRSFNYSGAPGVLTIKAQGKNIPKAITIAEILKRKLEGSLHQFTEIGQVTEEEVWDPKATTATAASSSSSSSSTSQKQQQQLDPIRLLRHRPTIRIRLSKHLDTHHPPRTEDESDMDEDEKEMIEQWPGAILDRDAAVRRLVGYQAPTGNDIYL
ncbi:hypothetical protein BGW42_002021 [Actinomortierella wolfii]|nr:hypothetical protein BGW42_002021 [Actinomortierella wolfii]